jgi:2-polyprenyl-3-methyl-5-hydroxy-6-metoxy-1,4-benzoquinol methylase
MKSQRFKKQQNNKAESQSCLLCCHKLSINIDNVFDTRFGIHKGFGIAKCLSCDLEHTVPILTPKELKKLYEEYYNFGGEKGTFYTRVRQQILSSTAYRLWIYADGDICFHGRKGSGRLLDIGCNEGRGLKIYQRNGYDAEGLELNEVAAEEARAKGFIVYSQGVEDFQPEQPYDVVVLSNVLEHSLDPKNMLYHVHRILKSTGQVWISCPNSQSWLRSFFGKRWINWHVPFHIVHFSPQVLSKLLKDVEFDIVHFSQVTPALWVAHSVIFRLFAMPGQSTRQLRSTLLVTALMLTLRLLCFPYLCLGNRLGRGDCLVVIGKKIEKLVAKNPICLPRNIK